MDKSDDYFGSNTKIIKVNGEMMEVIADIEEAASDDGESKESSSISSFGSSNEDDNNIESFEIQ